VLCCTILGQWIPVYAPGKEIVEQELRVISKYVARITAYTSSVEETGRSDGLTKYGVFAKRGIVAADDLPFGTLIRIGGRIYTVTDTFGGGYKGKIDIWMEDKEEAIEFGVQHLEVEVVEKQ
jgi:3D (Asp-Asp-Asp) domain-containing protein